MFIQLRIDELIKDLSSRSDLEIIKSLAERERFSKDFFDYSPLLVEKFKGCLGDVVVKPLTQEAVLKVASACSKYHIPLTIRASGTGNYGQCVPLEGGVVMLMTSLRNIRSFNEATGEIYIESGCLLRDIDYYLFSKGRQLRLSPSTWRSASIGGFIAGGSGGVGSVKWGFLRDPGHLKGLEVITIEDSPRTIHLDAASSEPLNHAYGTNGIITALKISTTHHVQWHEVVIDCFSFENALQLLRICISSAIDINLATLLEDKIVRQLPQLFGKLKGDCRLLFLVAPDGVNDLEILAARFGACFKDFGPEDLNSGRLMREITWNHTTLHIRAKDSNWTYLQMLLPQPENQAIELINSKWRNDILWHLEAVRQQGVQRLAALPLIKWSGEKKLRDLMNYVEDLGAINFNPHAITVEDGGLGLIDGDQVKAKELYDPKGLMNPGKLKGWLLKE